MLRAALLFLLGVFLGACAQTAAVPPVAPSRIDAAAELSAKTVALVQRREDASVRPYCTGVWISETSILTAFHCIADEEISARIDYVEREDVYAPGEVAERAHVVTRSALILTTDEDHDLAMLRTVDGGAHAVARLSLAQVRPGQFAQAMGHSMGLWWSYSSGDIAAIRERNFGGGSMVYVQATTPISPGNSGGGLFDASGFLIGMADATLGGRAQNLNLFVHPQYIHAFIVRAGT